jgi:hypothetical protein
MSFVRHVRAKHVGIFLFLASRDRFCRRNARALTYYTDKNVGSQLFDQMIYFSQKERKHGHDDKTAPEACNG